MNQHTPFLNQQKETVNQHAAQILLFGGNPPAQGLSDAGLVLITSRAVALVCSTYMQGRSSFRGTAWLLLGPLPAGALILAVLPG